MASLLNLNRFGNPSDKLALREEYMVSFVDKLTAARHGKRFDKLMLH